MRFRVAGVTFENRQHIIRKYCTEGDQVELIAEPDNPYDENAVKVVVKDSDGNQFTIGYVPRKQNAEIADYLRTGDTLTGILFEIHGGENELSIGVTVDVDMGLE